MITIITVTINGITYTAMTDGVDILINLCPHDISFVVGDTMMVVPPSGQLARCVQTTSRNGRMFMGIPVSMSQYGEVMGLPEAMEHVGFIVSGMVKGRCPSRDDVFAPAETIRTETGQVAGATSLGA